MVPILLSCETKSNKTPIIFKCGDDLRQDQLTIQMFKLFDNVSCTINQNKKTNLQIAKIYILSEIHPSVGKKTRQYEYM